MVKRGEAEEGGEETVRGEDRSRGGAEEGSPGGAVQKRGGTSEDVSRIGNDEGGARERNERERGRESA